MTLTRKIIDRLSIFFAGFFCALAFQSLAFTEPSSNPPAGNVSAPINTGPTSQDKGGGNAWITADGLGSRYGALFATVSGNVGIGTTSAPARFTVRQSTDSQTTLGAIATYNTAGTGVTQLITGADNTTYLFNGTGNDYLVLTNAGKVGIDTSGPGATFQVNSAGNPSQWAGFFSGSDYGVYADANGPSPSWGGEFIGGYGLYAQDTSGYYGEIGNGGYSFYGNGTVYAPSIQAGNGWSGSFQIVASGCPSPDTGTYDLIVTDGVITGHTALVCTPPQYVPPPPPQY